MVNIGRWLRDKMAQVRGNRWSSLPWGCRWVRLASGPGKREWAILCMPRSSPGKAPWPVLYLLHGAGHGPASYFSSLNMGALLPLAGQASLVFLDGQKGWYLDSPMDPESKGEQAILRMVEDIEERFPVGGSQRNRAICGFSMGGFGAMHLAVRHADLFPSASSLLGPLDIDPLWPDHPMLSRLLGGERATWYEHNPTAHVRALRGLRLLVTTGDEAWDRSLNESFVRACRSQGVPVIYRAHQGRHDTEFVAAHLKEHLEFHLTGWSPSFGPRGASWHLRPARPEDAADLFRNCFAARGREEITSHVAWSVHEVERGRRVHLVVDAGEPVATAELSLEGARAEIANLVVKPEMQGQGLGSALIRALAEEAAARGIEVLTIGVRASDTRTRLLYERNGFRFDHESTLLLDGEYVRIAYLQKSLQPKEG